MKRGIIWISLTFLIVTSIVLASCSSSTTIATTTTTQPTTTTSTVATTITSASTTNPTSTTSAATTVSATTTSTGNWWDSEGAPQYGGTLTIQTSTDITSFDPYDGETFNQIFTGYMEELFMSNWTVNPSEQDYQFAFWSNDEAEGGLVNSWEFTNPRYLCSPLAPWSILAEHCASKWSRVYLCRCCISF